jgi:hypothetical protein
VAEKSIEGTEHAGSIPAFSKYIFYENIFGGEEQDSTLLDIEMDHPDSGNIRR